MNKAMKIDRVNFQLFVEVERGSHDKELYVAFTFSPKVGRVGIKLNEWDELNDFVKEQVIERVED